MHFKLTIANKLSHRPQISRVLENIWNLEMQTRLSISLYSSTSFRIQHGFLLQFDYWPLLNRSSSLSEIQVNWNNCQIKFTLESLLILVLFLFNSRSKYTGLKIKQPNFTDDFFKNCMLQLMILFPFFFKFLNGLWFTNKQFGSTGFSVGLLVYLGSSPWSLYDSSQAEWL